MVCAPTYGAHRMVIIRGTHQGWSLPSVTSRHWHSPKITTRHSSWWIYLISLQYGLLLIMDILDITLIWHIMIQFWWTNFSKYPTSHSVLDPNVAPNLWPEQQVWKTPWMRRIFPRNEHFNWQIAWLLMNSLGGRNRWQPASNCRSQTSTETCYVPGSVENFDFVFRTFDLNKWIWMDRSNCTVFFWRMALHAHHLKRSINHQPNFALIYIFWYHFCLLQLVLPPNQKTTHEV